MLMAEHKLRVLKKQLLTGDLSAASRLGSARHRLLVSCLKCRPLVAFRGIVRITPLSRCSSHDMVCNVVGFLSWSCDVAKQK